jgi:hypothetical protein
MMNPTLGRFLQRDPATFIDGPNVYQFVRSNPIKYLDPTGLDTHQSASGQLVGITNKTTEPIIVERDTGDPKNPLEYIVLNPGEKTPANKDYDYVWYHSHWWKVRPQVPKAAKDLITGDWRLNNSYCQWEIHLFTITNDQTYYNFDGQEHSEIGVNLFPTQTKQIFPVGPGTTNNIWYPGQKGETIPQSAIDQYQSAWILGGGVLDDLNTEVNFLLQVTKLHG